MKLLIKKILKLPITKVFKETVATYLIYQSFKYMAATVYVIKRNMKESKNDSKKS